MPPNPDALAVGARVRLALAYHAAAGTPERPTDLAELAIAIGASVTTLRGVLGGHRGPPASWGRARGRVTPERLAQALGCPVEALAPAAPPHAVLPLRMAPREAWIEPAVASMGSLDPRPEGPPLDEVVRGLNWSDRIGR